MTPSAKLKQLWDARIAEIVKERDDLTARLAAAEAALAASAQRELAARCELERLSVGPYTTGAVQRKEVEVSEFENKLVSGLKEFAACQHEHLKCEKCGARSNLFGWTVFCKEYHELGQRLAAAEAALTEANRRLAEIRAELCGKGLEVAGWHQNSGPEPRGVVRMASDTIKQEWLDHLRHMLGCTVDTKKRLHGYRNYFCAEVGTAYHRDMLEMEAAGLVKSGCVINQGTCVYFHATIEGCKAINMSRSQIKRAMED